MLAEASTDHVIDIQWENWKSQREEWKAQGKQGSPPEFRPKWDDDVWKGFRDWLLENVFHNKCAYCETSFVGFIGEIGRASLGKECRSRWSPYHEKKKKEKITIIDR